jgi:hypothetical protein
MMLQITDRNMERAADSLLDMGVMGAMFILVLIGFGFLARWAVKTHVKQLHDKDKEIVRLQSEIAEMRKGYRESIESAIDASYNAINHNSRTLEENTKFLNEIRISLIKVLESKL